MTSLERTYPWLLIVPVVLPVVVWSGFIYPYLVPKTLVFYAFSFTTLAVFGLLVAHGRAFFWARLARMETWIPALLLVLAYVASIAGIDFYRSFWSLFIRGDGLLMLTCAVASFYLLLLSADETLFTRLVRATAIVGSFVAVYGIVEWILDGGRIGGLLGNAAFFAGYLGISLFATLIAARPLPPPWRGISYAGALAQVLAIILTATRGTMLALILAGIAYLLYLAVRGTAGVRRVSAGALIVLAIAAGLFFALRTQLAKMPFEPIARVASIGANDPDVASRLFIWRNMATEIRQNLWLGVGAEHIDVLFNRFYDPRKISEQWFDRSHNAFLDYAAQYGIGGLLLYLALIGTFALVSWRLFKRDEEGLAVLAGLLALTYAAQNFFIFDTISSFWLLLALLATLLAGSGDSVPLEVLPVSRWSRYAAWLAALILAMLLLPVSVRPALAAYDLAHAYLYQLVDVTQEARFLSQGFALGTYADLEYGYEAYDMYANHQANVLTGEARLTAYKATRAILEANFNRYTSDTRTALYLAHVLSLTPPGASPDPALLSAALTRAIEGSPKRSQPWYILTNLSIDAANAYPPRSAERIAGYAAARDILTRYIALVPTLSEPHYVLAQLNLASGDTAAAAAEAVLGKQYYQGDLATARLAAVYYENMFDLTDAKFFLMEVLHSDPSDAAVASDLAKIQAYERSKK